MKRFKFEVEIHVPDDAYEADAKYYIEHAIACHQGSLRPSDPMSGVEDGVRVSASVKRAPRKAVKQKE